MDGRNIYEYVTCGACIFSKAEEKILRFQEYPVTYWHGLKVTNALPLIKPKNVRRAMKQGKKKDVTKFGIQIF